MTSPSLVGRFITFYSTANIINVHKNGVILASRTITLQTAVVDSEFFKAVAIKIGNANYSSSARIDVTQTINFKLTAVAEQAMDADCSTYKAEFNR